MQPPKSNHPTHLRVVEGPRRRKYPPELANISDQELVAMCFAGIELVERVMKKVDPGRSSTRASFSFATRIDGSRSSEPCTTTSSFS